MESPLPFSIRRISLSPSFSDDPLYFRYWIRKLFSFSSFPLFLRFPNSSSVALPSAALPSALCCSGFISSYTSKILPSVLHISLWDEGFPTEHILASFFFFFLIQRPPRCFESHPRNRLGSIATIISITNN